MDFPDISYYKLDDYHNNQPYFFYILPNCMISNLIQNNMVWEKHLHNYFDKYINKNSIVLECGCHIGTHTIKLAKLCDKLYAFEPLPSTNMVLRKNLELNSIDNVIVSENGVSDQIGKTKYNWIENGNPGCSGLDDNPMGIPPWIPPLTQIIEVDLITIDSLNLNRLDFMKIDVEGYETKVIRGAMNTIRRCKPTIIMEVWKNHFGEVDLDYTKELFADLLDMGYDVINIEGPDFLFTPIL